MAAEDVIAEIHGFSEPDSTPTPWPAGIEQLRVADTYWLSTVRPDGRPHVTPLIAVWHAEALWFVTGPEERKAKNLVGNPSSVLTTGRSDLVEGALDLMIEGRAEQVTDAAELAPVAIAFADKYPAGPWDFVVRNGAFSDRYAGWARERVPGTPGARPGIPKGRSLQPDNLEGLPINPDAKATPVSQTDPVRRSRDTASCRSGIRSARFRLDPNRGSSRPAS